MFGLLNIDKPLGVTSREAVNRVQRRLRPTKVGHAGTLDPLARGVLLLCVGPATRLVPYLHKMPKRYRAEFLLGRESDTEDIEGQVVEITGAPVPPRDQLENVLGDFLGDISQRPPAYSALKLKGQRAYKLARAGKRVELAPRTVTVHDLQLVDYDYPRLQLDIACGSGTYIRCLGRDIAARLGTAAVMSALTRTAIGDFSLDEAIGLETVAADAVAPHLIPAVRAAPMLPQIELTDRQWRQIARGMTIEARPGLASGTEIAALDRSGQLVAILTMRGPGRLGPVRNFVSPQPIGQPGSARQ